MTRTYDVKLHAEGGYFSFWRGDYASVGRTSGDVNNRRAHEAGAGAKADGRVPADLVPVLSEHLDLYRAWELLSSFECLANATARCDVVILDQDGIK